MPDDQEYEEFVRRVAPRLYRHALSLCGDPHIAQDLTQEALLRLYQRWSELDPARNPVAYAYRTVRNLHVDRLERRSTAELVLDELPDRQVPGEAEATHLKIDMARVLALLPARERAVLVARYLNDMSVQDTAASLGVSEAVVRTTSYRALNRLKSLETPRARTASGPTHHVAF